ncbi:MAG: FliG C-terminal domain-containing protein [Aureliella sp.]
MLTRPERLALLLNILGDEATEMAKSGLTGDALSDLEAAIKDFEEYPPSNDEVQTVLEDFEQYFELAMQTSAKVLEEEAAKEAEEEEEVIKPRILEVPEDEFDVEIEPTRIFPDPLLSGNVAKDLSILHPYRVAQVLRHENPLTVSLVVRHLANEHAAKTLELIPDEMRAAIFLNLALPVNVKPIVLQRIFETTRDLALLVEERKDEEESSAKMANLMRSMPKTLRGPMMEELNKKDSKLSDKVKKLLYRFEDLKRINDKDMQQLLANCRSETLVMALQKVDEDLLARVLGNMSKRAKEALQEEIEFAANAKQEEIDQGREEIVRVLAELDESGKISIE